MEGDDAGGPKAGGPGIDVLAGRVSKSAAAALAKAKSASAGPVIAPASNVAAASLPEHLRVSSITGEASKTLGFVHIQGQQQGTRYDPAGSGGGIDVEMVDNDVSAYRATGAHGLSSSSSGLDDTNAPFVYDTNINADQDVALAEEQAAAAAASSAAGGEGAAAGAEGDLSNEYLWQLLFDQAQDEDRGGEAAAGEPPPQSAAEEEEEWEDVDADTASAAPTAVSGAELEDGGPSTHTQQPSNQGVIDGTSSAAVADDDDWEDA